MSEPITGGGPETSGEHVSSVEVEFVEGKTLRRGEVSVDLDEDEIFCLRVLMQHGDFIGVAVFREHGFPWRVSNDATKRAFTEAITGIGYALKVTSDMQKARPILKTEDRSPKYKINPLIKIVVPADEDQELMAEFEAADKVVLSASDEAILRNAGLRTPAEIALFLSGLRPDLAVTAAQVANLAAANRMIVPHEGKYSIYAARLIAQALGIAYPRDEK